MSRYDLTDFEWRAIGRMASSPRRPVGVREYMPVRADKPEARSSFASRLEADGDGAERTVERLVQGRDRPSYSSKSYKSYRLDRITETRHMES